VAVIGHFWGSKGEVMIPQFVRQLIDKTGNDKWKFYMQGNWRHDVWKWYFYYMKHIIKELGLENNVILNEERVGSIDNWLEDKNFLVTFSMKDAFSIIVGEAMAKGIKALPHNFMGARDIWGKYVWNSFDELAYRLDKEYYNSHEYYDFVKDNYSNEVIMKLWENFIKI
jgi:glycosyltransferase involved in cell wall biosynthesis